MRIPVLLFFGSVLFSICVSAQTSQKKDDTSQQSRVCGPCIRSNMEYLASDAMRGRGSGSEDEHRAAAYIAGMLHRYGIPAATGKEYLQQANVILRTPTGPTLMKFRDATSKEITWTHGKEIVVLNMAQAEVSGPLQRMSDAGEKVKPGSVVYVSSGDSGRADIGRVLEQGVGAVLLPETPQRRQRWEALGQRPLHLPGQVEGVSKAGLGANANVVVVSEEAEAILKGLPEGTVIHLQVPTGPPANKPTWNVVAMLRGTDSILRKQAVLLSAHLDHIGIGAAVNGDDIYNGADDDASGVAAVLELARVLGQGKPPKRTVVFALFGSEEAGGLGAAYFREHPPVPLKDLVANLEFEMIGRADPAVSPDMLWLTGWERSNLGPELASHGAKLVADPHPAENFFARSDNYVLAKQGVVAQTVSSFGLHKDYHQPSDDLAHIDFTHMDAAIGSLIAPVQWLVNSEFVPKWVKGIPTSDVGPPTSDSRRGP
jgi:aminopeptidase YwaD